MKIGKKRWANAVSDETKELSEYEEKFIVV